MKISDRLFISKYKLSLKFGDSCPYFGAIIWIALALWLWLFLLFVVVTRVIIHDETPVPFLKIWCLLTSGLLLNIIYKFFRKKNIEELLDEFNSDSFSKRTLWAIVAFFLPIVPLVFIAILLSK